MADELLKIYQNGKLYSLGELVGKTIVANEKTPTYRLPIRAEVLKNWYLKGRPALMKDSVFASRDVAIYSVNGNFYRNAKIGNYLGLFNGFYHNGDIRVFTASGNLLRVPATDFDWYKKSEIIGNIENKIGDIDNGSSIGVLYSWADGMDAMGKKDGSTWLSFRDSFSRPYYVPISGNTIDTRAIKTQGGKTVEEQIEEEKENSKTFADTAVDLVKKGFMFGLAAYVIVELGKSKIESQK